MRKIPTVLKRDPENPRRVLPEVTPGCEWVLACEGVATRKYDGTCCMLDGEGDWWARREVRPGKQPPAGFVPVETDPATGKTQGWEPIGQSPFARWHAGAVEDAGPLAPGTYELVGPKINENPEFFGHHVLVAHADSERLPDSTLRCVDELIALAQWCGEQGFEGVVWHHPDGRMAKLKARDVCCREGRAA